MMCEQSFEISICQADRGIRGKGFEAEGNRISEAMVAPVIHHCNCNSSASSMKVQHMGIPGKYVLVEQFFIKNTIEHHGLFWALKGGQFGFTSNFGGMEEDQHSAVLVLLPRICETTMSLGRAGSGHRETVRVHDDGHLPSSRVGCTGMMVWYCFYPHIWLLIPSSLTVPLLMTKGKCWKEVRTNFQGMEIRSDMSWACGYH